MKTVSKPRAFRIMLLPVLAFATVLLAHASPGQARWDCGGTPRGQVCHHVP